MLMMWVEGLLLVSWPCLWQIWDWTCCWIHHPLSRQVCLTFLSDLVCCWQAHSAGRSLHHPSPQRHPPETIQLILRLRLAAICLKFRRWNILTHSTRRWLDCAKNDDKWKSKSNKNYFKTKAKAKRKRFKSTRGN